MEVNELFTKLKELGHVNTKRAELRELCKLHIDQILKYLPRRILNSDGFKIIDCLLNGLSDNSTAYRSKIKVIDIVVKTLRKESTSLTHCGNLISRIVLELGKVPANELVQWCNETVQSIVDDSDVNMIWKDVLPECLNAISATDTVRHCGTDMSSAEYKEQCVRTLCQCGWKERQLVQLTAMFHDMQLPRNEHKQVVNKICSHIMECPPDTLPALVHQLLKLCKTQDFDIVLSHLGSYFSVQLYSKLEPSAPDSEGTTMDIDDIVPHSPAEVSRCLSTCIYHVTEGLEKPQTCKWLRGWPRSQLLRAPFLLDLALSLSAEKDCRALCLDVSCLSTCSYHVTEGLEKPQTCKWLRGWPRSQLLRAPFLLDLALALSAEKDCRALCLDVSCLSTCIYHVTEGLEKPQTCKWLRGWPRSQLLRAPFLLDLALALSAEKDCRALCLDVSCLSTCSYHVTEGLEKPQTCKWLRGWPRSQLLRAPFLLDLALALSAEKDCRTLCLDVSCLSTCIYHVTEGLEKPQTCKWLRGWPRSQLLRAPFLLDLALALSAEKDCRTLCLDVSCLSTCIYHVTEGLEKPQTCKWLRGWPRSQLLRAPFLLDLALALSAEKDCRTLCLDVSCLSTCIYHVTEGLEKPQTCKWLRGWPRSQLLRAPFLLDLALALSAEKDCRALCLDVSCLSTCSYHVTEGLEKPQTCKWLRGWPRSQLLRAPFLLDLALALSAEKDCRALCLDVSCLSTCIYHVTEGLEKPQTCKWLRGWPRSQLLRAPFLLDLALALSAEKDCRALCLDVSCLSTCSYHVTEGLEKPQTCKWLRGWPRSQLLRAPFLLDLALALSAEKDCRALCLDVSCLSTCSYHVTEGLEKPQTCKWLRGWPRSQLLRAPFLLDLALALSAEKDCRALCLDVSCLSTCSYHVTEGLEKPQTCKWLRGWPRSQLLRAPFLLDLALALSAEKDCRALCLNVSCLSTCSYHVTEGLEKPQTCKWLRGWPRSQLLRAPFLLDLALALSAEKDCRTLCLDVIKAGIISREADARVRGESAAARAVLPRAAPAADVLRVLTTESASHRQLTVLGLIHLAFSLLSVARSKPHAQQCWSLGKLVLARLSKAQPGTAPHILSQLADRTNTPAVRAQYADCLYVLCKLTPLSIERCSQLTAILENCKPSTDFKSAAHVLNAVYPLINFSIRTRDSLFMVCRKGINSRDSAHRCLALSGFLTVLRHVRVSGAFSGSQSCSDSHASYLTQLTIVHSTQAGAPAVSSVRNEAVLLEVVSVLRRCLAQDAAVKQLLYSKLYECVKDKPGLHESILEFLHEHLSKYLPEDQPLLWDQCVQVTATSAVLVEPISHLLYVTAQFLQEEEEELEDILASQAADSSAVLRSKLAIDLGRLCDSDNFAQLDMEDPGLSDLTPESKAKSLKVQQMLLSYEALIGYQIMRWDRNSQRAATIVLNLFKGYSQLLENTKAAPKLGKKGSKATLNETNKSQKSQKSQKDKEKASVKVSTLTKDRGSAFKTLPCVWDLKLCLRVMELLYSEEVPWCTIEQRNRVRSSREFHHWALRCVRSVVEQTDRQQAKLVAEIAALLYKRCICRFRDMCDFDDTTALGCVELFKDCLEFILSPDNNLKTEALLSNITSMSDEQESTYIAAILEQVHAALAQIEEESAEEERDLVIKRLVSALCQLAAALLEPACCCDRYTAVLLKLEDYVRTSKQDCLSLIPPLLTAGCRTTQEAPLLDDLLDKLASALGRIDEEDTSAGGEEPTNFPSIDCRTGHTVLTQICVHLSSLARVAEHLLHRAKDLSAALPLATRSSLEALEREQNEVYSAAITQLCQLTAWTTSVGKLRCSVGGGSNRVLQTLARLYSLLASLARQLTPRELTIHLRSVERLLKLCGKKLSAVVDNLVMYLEASQAATSRTVLRDTKLIPRLVFEGERFCRQLALLSAKTKVNLMQHLPMGTARDFRIRAPVIEEMLKDHEDLADEIADEEEEAAEMPSPVASDDDTRDEPPSKKRRS